MARLVYTVTAAGATAGTFTSGAIAQTSAYGLGAQNTIVASTHPMIEKWLAAAWVQTVTL